MGTSEVQLNIIARKGTEFTGLISEQFNTGQNSAAIDRDDDRSLLSPNIDAVECMISP